jgi:hypothetical protein
MGTVAVTDVYNSRTPWPADTRITALRIIQVLPKTTPVAGQPNIGVAGQTLARTVLGTVPVEADGSAHFELPAGKAVYFQALDERGLAVQSMRSDTYVHPGERLVCGGCHEERHRVAPALKASPLAFRRAPSRIEPDVEGSNPFNFVRLVQPAIERSCMPCHREKHVSANLSFGGMASYGFHFGSGAGNFNDPFPRGGSRTVMGKFGARASKMLAVLDDANHRGKVPYEDFHRVTLWIDANCAMLGSYEEDAKQRRGEIVWPSLE